MTTRREQYEDAVRDAEHGASTRRKHSRAARAVSHAVERAFIDVRAAAAVRDGWGVLLMLPADAAALQALAPGVYRAVRGTTGAELCANANAGGFTDWEVAAYCTNDDEGDAATMHTLWFEPDDGGEHVGWNAKDAAAVMFGVDANVIARFADMETRAMLEAEVDLGDVAPPRSTLPFDIHYDSDRAGVADATAYTRAFVLVRPLQ